MRRRSALAAATLFVALLAPLLGKAHEGNFPILLVHGWTGTGASFDEMIPKLQAQGYTVLDCNTAQAGTQALTYAPTSGTQHISYIAGKILQPKINTCLTDNGYATTQKIDIVAHSMGGLTSRFLVEKGGADVDFWNSTTGWYGDGIPDVDTKWKNQVDDVIMLGTPNHGTILAWVPSTLPVFGVWSASGGDMRPGAKLLTLMGYAEPTGEYYTCVGGNPSYGQFYQSDFDGDGVTHGFDGVVPAESPFLTGCDNNIVSSNHSGLRTDDAPIDITINALGFTSTQTGTGGANLAGQATIRLEYFDIVQDHDSGTTDEYRFEVSWDSNGGGDGYSVGDTIQYNRDATFTQNWANGGPSTWTAVNLPGTAPTVDVKIRVWEDDTGWGGGQEAVSTFYFNNVMLSEDIDGLENYSDTAPDAKGGTNTLKISLNGVTADVSQTRLITFGFDKAWVSDNHECCGFNGEEQFTARAGRKGYESTFYRGDPDTGTHYSRPDNAWVNIGTDTKNNGQVESETIWKIRMLNSATWHLDVAYWEDDGGWSSRDGGNAYTFEGSVSGQPAGRTNYTGTSWGDWDGYLYITAAG
jgi:triacylglycerol esterase/lipase EstA (alpha/beta hydrolase family)